MKSGFSISRLIVRGLTHFGKINAAVLLAAAVGVAVLTGSLLVGASMRGSLRELALARLGRVKYAMITESFFREALARDLKLGSPCAAAILLNGSVAHATSGARTGKAQAIGVTDDFWAFGKKKMGGALADDEAAVNAALARVLGARAGDEVILRVQKPSAIPRETFIGERDDTVATLRLRVAMVLEANTIGDFALGGSQQEPFNIFVSLGALQRRLGQAGGANALLTAEKPGDLKKNLKLEDAGLRLVPNAGQGYIAVESSRIFMPPYLATLTTESAAEVKAKARPTLTYLANTIRAGGQSTPYSMIAGMDDLGLREGEIAINDWEAEDLGAKVGDKIAVGYYLPAAGRLIEATATLTLARIVPLEGAWADRALTPDFPGLKEANQLSKWKPPFPLEMKRIRRKDEDYWNKYKATPKAFVSLATGRALWKNPYGSETSIRVYGANEAALREAMTRKLDPAAAGLAPRPVREQALAASQGASDFGGLFIGFSLFLLVSAAMLIRMLFTLGVQGRAREYGLLGATGFRPATIRRMMLAEGALIAAGGAALGTALGIGYAALMLYGLRTWWVGAIGTPFLRLHVDGASLAGGALGGWFVALLAVWLAARRLAKQPARALLAGRSVEEGMGRAPVRISLALAAITLVMGIALAVMALSRTGEGQAEIFFGSGALLLISMLSLFRVWLKRTKKNAASGGSDLLTITRLGVLAARRRPGRSMMVAGLMASASFVVIAVGANRREAVPTTEKHSGTGGFLLQAESTLPVYENSKRAAGQAPDSVLDPETLGGAEALALRLRPGDDASCLNLYKSARPRVLGAPAAFIRRGGFVFASSAANDKEAKGNPWLLLERKTGDGTIPVIGDYNSVVWLLHSGLGKTIEVDGRRLRFVALLKGSIFQSELIVSEENFKRLFPAESGYRFFLVGPPGDAPRLARALETRYENYGLDAVETAERLNELLKVENTYLATFQALGGLGLLLGTAGLGLILLRNLYERRAELALLRAVGWRRGRLIWLTASENLLLLAVGMGAGVISALVAAAPAMLTRLSRPPWGGLAMTLAAIILFGVAAILASAAAALRSPLLRTIKSE